MTSVPPVAGRQLVVERYNAVAPYSQNAALVKREDGRWVNYQFERGENGPSLPYTDVISLHAHEQCEAGLTDTGLAHRRLLWACLLLMPAADGLAMSITAMVPRQ